MLSKQSEKIHFVEFKLRVEEREVVHPNQATTWRNSFIDNYTYYYYSATINNHHFENTVANVEADLTSRPDTIRPSGIDQCPPT